ncbi:MAG: type IV pilus secretin PilQ [bacterium]|nr:type IV pilus secretin PilQ [bacterium]
MLHSIRKITKPLLCILVLIIIALLTACASQNAAKGTAAGETKLITDITTSEDAESTLVTVKGDQKLTYTAIKQVFPLGVLFDFPGTALDNVKAIHYPPENDYISSIRATQIEEGGKTSRIFIALKKDLPYTIEPGDAGLSIVFPKPGLAAAEKPSETAEAEGVEEEPALKEPEPEPAKEPAPPATRMTSVSATPQEKSAVVSVKADGTITNYKSFIISESPPRIVYDMYKLKSPFKGEQRIAVKSDQISKIRHFSHPEKIRIVLETKKAYLSKHTARPVDNGLEIYIGEAPAVMSGENPVAVEPAVAIPMQASAAESAEAEVSKPVENDKPAWLNRIEFAGEDAGKSAIVVGTTRPVEYQLIKVDSKRLHLKLLNTNLPEYRKRALITTRFQSAVDRITPTYSLQSKATVIDVELREGVPYFVKQTEDVIRISFSASTIPPRPYEDAKLPAWKQVVADSGTQKAPATAATMPSADKQTRFPAAEESLKPAVKKRSTAERLESLKPVEKKMSLAERLGSVIPTDEKYTGEKIALDFYDTDIKNVFRIIREISGKNFAIDKNVTGKVTLTLDTPVPWDQVLELVLKMNQLGMTMEGDIIRIATLNSLAQEEKLKQAQLKATQQAVMQQKALEPLVTAYISVSYSNAQSEVLPHVQTILTEGRGKVSVDTRNNQLILTDTAEKIEQVRDIVMRIDKVTPQVVIEARIVEANTSFTRDLGFDWGEVTAGPFDVGSSELTLRGLASNLPAAAPSGVAGFDFLKLSGTPFTIIDAKLVVSETEGKTNIISAPKVVTLDNKKAKIKQGLEVPYQERDSSGNSTIRFKNVDLLLEVTPNVTPDNRIIMKIFVTKNDVATQTEDGPALSTNEAETELLIENGDTIVIGGIVKSTITYGEKGIPGMSKVGVLGWLFKSQSKLDAKNELLIFITPRIVTLEQKKGMNI